MREVETISWRELTGNKFNRAIDTAMLSNSGCVKSIAVRRVGDDVKSHFHVVFDRNYLIEWISRKVCKPLFTLGKQGTLDLVSEAWDYCYGRTDEVKPVSVVDS